MSDEPVLATEQEVGGDEKVKTREAAEQAQALDKLTDKVEEKELDQAKVQRAMAEIAASEKTEQEVQRQRQKELAAVKLKKEDVELVALEFELDKKLAESRLREHRGNVKAALVSFL